MNTTAGFNWIIAAIFAGVCLAGFAVWWFWLRKLEARRAQEKAAEKKDEKPKRVGIYPAMVFTPDGIKFKKIPEKKGNTFLLTPSMPVQGDAYLVTEKTLDVYEAYDPRLVPLDSKDTPQRAYRAVTIWEKPVSVLFSYAKSNLEAVNMILAWVVVVGFFFLAFQIIDKWGK